MLAGWNEGSQSSGTATVRQLLWSGAPTSVASEGSLLGWLRRGCRMVIGSKCLSEGGPMTSQALAICIIHVLSTKDKVADHPHARTVRDVAPLIQREAEKFGLDPLLLGAVGIEESRFDRHAVSVFGAQGMFQIMPGTTASRGFERLEPRQLQAPRINVHLAARHLAHLRDKCGGPPSRWVSPYGGFRCGPSSYSKKVLLTYRRLLKAAVPA